MGNFQLPPGDDIAGYRLWFYDVPFYQMDDVRAVGTDLAGGQTRQSSRVCRRRQQDEPDVTAMPVPRTHTGSVSLHSLSERSAAARAADRRPARRARVADALGRPAARQSVRGRGSRRAGQGGRPDLERDTTCSRSRDGRREAAIERIRGFTDSAGLVLLERKPASREAPPTLLDNPEQAGRRPGDRVFLAAARLSRLRSFVGGRHLVRDVLRDDHVRRGLCAGARRDARIVLAATGCASRADERTPEPGAADRRHGRRLRRARRQLLRRQPGARHRSPRVCRCSTSRTTST